MGKGKRGPGDEEEGVLLATAAKLVTAVRACLGKFSSSKPPEPATEVVELLQDMKITPRLVMQFHKIFKRLKQYDSITLRVGPNEVSTASMTRLVKNHRKWVAKIMILCKMAYAKQGQEGKTRLERFQDAARDLGHFLYNKDGENGEVQVMGRNGKSWAKILVFFFIFYGCLAAFFASMLTIFMTTVPPREDGPKMTRYLAGKQGLIPLPAVITKNPNVDDIVSSINSFLKPYKEAVENKDGKYQNCTDGERKKGSKPCIMDLTSLGECYNDSSDFKYGHDEGKPCIFMKMNRVYNWVPEPNDGKDYVELSCKFEESKSDAISILPEDKPGFPAKFYPYFSEEAWLSPIAAVQVNNPSKVPVVVLCEALAKNIELSETYRLSRGATGRVRIEINQE